MSVFDNETYLPGVITEIEADYAYGYDTSLFGTTDSEVVIGTAFDGPVGELNPVYSPEHARYVYGKMYSNESKAEATLVAGIQDAYDRGCRTIYAVRVGGKELYKDFELCVDTGIKLRVSAINPSNIGKSVCMTVSQTTGLETLTIYKPAIRATIAEKMQGLVVSTNDVLATELKFNQDYGLSKDSKLVEYIDIVNKHQYNNVLKLSLVDSEGNDVTNSTETFGLCAGALFPGIYFIGRDKSSCAEITDVKYQLITDAVPAKPFSSFEGKYFKKIVTNTDVSESLPIYASSLEALKAVLKESGISMVKAYDFLSTDSLSERAFPLSSTDYEEVDLSSFDIYKRLGKGFAITAMAEKRLDGSGNELTPRVKETSMSDSGRVATITDGIYSMIENAAIKYRTLSCGSADEKISSKLPRPSDFAISVAKDIEILDGLILATPKINSASAFSPKEYSFSFSELGVTERDSTTDIYTEAVMKIIPSIASISELTAVGAPVIPSGTLLMLLELGVGKLIRVGTSSYEVLTGIGLIGEKYLVDGNIYEAQNIGGVATFAKAIPVPTTGGNATYQSKEYVIGENHGKIFVFKVTDNLLVSVSPLGDLNTMLTDNIEKTLIFSKSNYFETNDVIIKSGIFGATTVEELVELMNNHDTLSDLFVFSLTDTGAEKKDEYVLDAAGASIAVSTKYNLLADRVPGWNYSLYIPYRTTDNFARQLAQHCTYTELKTAATHGFIGCSRIVDTSLNSIAKKVNSLLDAEFDLYAKNDIGRNMLDKSNLPYPIGKNISIVFSQYYVIDSEDKYQYISSGAPGYAGMVSTLPLDQSSTNQSIDIGNLMFNLTNNQLMKLNQKGIVTIKQSFSKGLVVTDGITMAPVASIFHRLGAIRIIGAVEDLIRAASEPFIGKQNHDANRNSLQTAIKSNLDKIKGTLIEDYDFTMVIDKKIMKLSYVSIDYRVVPIYEIREVRNRISMKDQL